MKQRNIQIVQVLRGMACVAIILFHLPNEWGGEKANYSAFPLSIFFLLTGYFLLEGTRKTEKGYFRKKAIRIFPLYWSLTVLIFAASFIIPGINHGRNYTVENLIKSILFIPYYNSDGKLFPILSVGWTLIIEIYDYIIFWGIYRFLKKSKRREGLTITVISVMLAFTVVIRFYLHSSPLLDIWTNKYQLPFILGLVLSWLMNGKEDKKVVKCVIAWPYLLIGLLFLFYIFCYQVPDNYAWSYGFILVAAAVSVFRETEFPQWSIYLGNISYSVYLIHKFVIVVAEKVITHFSITPITAICGVVFVFVITIITASISYALIEKRFCQFLNRVLCSD